MPHRTVTIIASLLVGLALPVAAHARITRIDIEKAAERVEHSVDILILKPVDMSRGNRTLIYDSVNRGNLRAIEVFNLEDAPTAKPANSRLLAEVV